MKITYVSGQGLSISQGCYIFKILEPFQMDKCRAVSAPQALVNLPLPVMTSEDDVNDPNMPYR